MEITLETIKPGNDLKKPRTGNRVGIWYRLFEYNPKNSANCAILLVPISH